MKIRHIIIAPSLGIFVLLFGLIYIHYLVGNIPYGVDNVFYVSKYCDLRESNLDVIKYLNKALIDDYAVYNDTRDDFEIIIHNFYNSKFYMYKEGRFLFKKGKYYESFFDGCYYSLLKDKYQ